MAMDMLEPYIQVTQEYAPQGAEKVAFDKSPSSLISTRPRLPLTRPLLPLVEKSSCWTSIGYD